MPRAGKTILLSQLAKATLKAHPDAYVIVLLIDDQAIIAEVPELPGCVCQDKDEAEAMANIREAIAGWLWAEEQKKAEAQL